MEINTIITDKIQEYIEINKLYQTLKQNSSIKTTISVGTNDSDDKLGEIDLGEFNRIIDRITEDTGSLPLLGTTIAIPDVEKKIPFIWAKVISITPPQIISGVNGNISYDFGVFITRI